MQVELRLLLVAVTTIDTIILLTITTLTGYAINIISITAIVNPMVIGTMGNDITATSSMEIIIVTITAATIVIADLTARTSDFFGL